MIENWRILQQQKKGFDFQSFLSVCTLHEYYMEFGVENMIYMTCIVPQNIILQLYPCIVWTLYIFCDLQLVLLLCTVHVQCNSSRLS